LYQLTLKGDFMQDVDKLELLASAINGLVDIGEEVMKDGSVNLLDLPQLGPLAKEVEKLVQAVKAYKEIGEELKDIDPVEAVKLVQTLFAKN